MYQSFRYCISKSIAHDNNTIGIFMETGYPSPPKRNNCKIIKEEIHEIKIQW